MNWVKSFYSKQYEWGNLFASGVADYHHQKASQVKGLAGPSKKRILELGSGGGENALAMASLGHDVVAVELVGSAVENGRSLAKELNISNIEFIHGNFYEVDFADRFDLVCYWDGFGVGTDDEQHKLLKRIHDWLKPDGCSLIDVYTPWYASYTAGIEVPINKDTTRRYDFDGDQCRWLDSWWPTGDKEQAVTQSLRCYSPADLRQLLCGTGLILENYDVGGAMDWEKGEYQEKAPLKKAMYYTAKLIKE